MGTRGIFGLRKNGKDKISYNHYDSSPNCLGEIMNDFVSDHDYDELSELFDRLELVDESFRTSQFTDEQKEKYKEYLKRKDFFNHSLTDNATGEDITMYQFLREYQGNLERYFEIPEIDLMIDNNEFIKDSMFCEWGYIINLDNKVLEVWKGFQREPDLTNRYGQEEISGYYPCKLVLEISFNEIRDSFSQTISERFFREEI